MNTKQTNHHISMQTPAHEPFWRYKISRFLGAICLLISFSNTILAEKLDSIGQMRIADVRFIIHKVTPKETTFSISQKYEVPIEVILKANQKQSTDIKVGDTIRIPFKADYAKWLNQVGGKIITGKTADSPKANFHLIQKGQTLYAVQRLYPHVTVKQLQDWNKKGPIKVGDTIYLQDPKTISQPLAADKANNKTAPNKNSVAVAPANTEKNLKLQPGIQIQKDLANKLQPQRNHVLHKTLETGTLIKIENEENKRVAFAKVIGKLPTTESYELAATNNLFELLGIKGDKAKVNLAVLD